MPVIKLTNIGGIAPSVLPRNLAPEAAQIAENLQARTTEFRPLADDKIVATSAVANPKSIYRLSRKVDKSLNTDPSTGWKWSAEAVNVVKGQVDDDFTDRNYYTLADGSAPPQVFDAHNNWRYLGVPAPTQKPTCTVNAAYTFTQEQKNIKVTQALQQAIKDVETLGAKATLVGIDAAALGPGWLRESAFSAAPDADRHIVRVFALDPATNKVIDTYSSMQPSEAAWIFDPALAGDYATLPAGFTAPAWAAGHTKWWRIRLRAYARAFDVNVAPTSSALQAIDMPGTQGAQKWLSATEANAMAARLAKAFDKNYPKVKGLVDELTAAQQEVARFFNQGGAVSLTAATKAFYARADVVAAMESAKNVYAEKIWRHIEAIGKATAQPYYVDNSGGG